MPTRRRVRTSGHSTGKPSGEVSGHAPCPGADEPGQPRRDPVGDMLAGTLQSAVAIRSRADTRIALCWAVLSKVIRVGSDPT
jgi:hypothetical protein